MFYLLLYFPMPREIIREEILHLVSLKWYYLLKGTEASTNEKDAF